MSCVMVPHVIYMQPLGWHCESSGMTTLIQDEMTAQKGTNDCADTEIYDPYNRRETLAEL